LVNNIFDAVRKVYPESKFKLNIALLYIAMFDLIFPSGFKVYVVVIDL